ncbi:MAG: chromosome segregation protein SMC [Chloroflexi bacterium]|nr:chromosome segregation protein SMC [Chloroflexota bacterium]
MKLKKLVLQGYKTFASKTEFVFDDGITAVVGPNGSGKSNVADAVRWVLGEQSYSTLRGKKTTDMIFAGSQKRARAGMAQATLTLDNSDGWLPIDYAEVEISRRAYRSGENEYLLNGQKVRRMDISDLLAKAGLAEQTYTIIGQGLIDQALSLKADERRALFEEAAGTSHYKSKRASTLRKLQETQANLLRVNDILGEIRPRLASLKRQASRAQSYQQVVDDLRHLLRIWYGYQWEQAKKLLRERRQTAALAEQSWQKARDKLVALQGEGDTVRQQLHEVQTAVQAQQSERDELRERVDKLGREVAIWRERRAALERQLAETSDELPELETHQQRAQQELELAVADLTAAQEELNQHQNELRHFEASFEQTQAAINHGKQAVQRLEQAVQAAQKAVATAEGQQSQLQERLAERQAAIQNEAELDGLRQQEGKLLAAVQSAENSAAELREQRHKLAEERRTLEGELKKLRRTQEEQRTVLNQLQTKIARQQAQTEMLDKMRQPDVKVGKEVHLLGQLAHFLDIPAEHQRGVEVALHGRLTTLLVADEENLWRLVRGKAPAQALTLMEVGRTAEAATTNLTQGVWAVEVVRCTDERVRPAAEALLSGLLLVADAAAARAIQPELPAGTAAVAPEGFIAHANGLVELPRTDGQTSVLAREAEWRTATAALDQLQDQFGELDEVAGETQTALRDVQRQMDDLGREERRLAGLENEAGQRLTRAQREADKVTQQVRFAVRQQEGQAAEIAQLGQKIAALQGQMADQLAIAQKAEAELAEARTQLASLPIAEAEQQRQGLRQQINSVRAVVDGRRAITDSRRTTLTQLEQQIQRVRQRRQDWSTQLLKMDTAAQESELASLEKRLAEVQAAVAPRQTEMGNIQAELRRLESEAAVSQKATHELETRYAQAKVALSQQESKLESLQERIQSELGLVSLAYDEDQTGSTPLPLGKMVETLPEVAELPNDLEESIQSRRNQLSRMGAINPDAPAEYEELQTRHDFLEQQLADLEAADGHLRRVIEELDELTSKAFAETVTKVNAVFGGMFQRLFGGGSAELLLTDPDDLTISGVDIIAQLPGRRPQGLALLSGGERSLTAASLIFALLTVSPTPFCMMDEVDAALDEANVTRFREVLQELSQKSQFIVITHNRGTVQAAQTIYGITMGEDSASQVISMKPEAYVGEERG